MIENLYWNIGFFFICLNPCGECIFVVKEFVHFHYYIEIFLRTFFGFLISGRTQCAVIFICCLTPITNFPKKRIHRQLFFFIVRKKIENKMSSLHEILDTFLFNISFFWEHLNVIQPVKWLSKTKLLKNGLRMNNKRGKRQNELNSSTLYVEQRVVISASLLLILLLLLFLRLLF